MAGTGKKEKTIPLHGFIYFAEISFMESGLVLDKDNSIREFRPGPDQPRSKVIRISASIVSYLFHPLFVPVYVIWFLINVQPALFASFSASQKMITIIRFFVMYSFFPLVTVLLAAGLGFLDSIFLRTQKDRIIPYIGCSIFYFWMSYVLRHQPEFSNEIVQFSMAIFIASSLGLLLNIVMKVSMHAISMGIMLTFVMLLAFSQAINYTLYCSVAILVTGLVCTARFIVSDHSQREIYMGLVCGIVSMIMAVWADGILP